MRKLAMALGGIGAFSALFVLVVFYSIVLVSLVDPSLLVLLVPLVGIAGTALTARKPILGGILMLISGTLPLSAGVYLIIDDVIHQKGWFLNFPLYAGLISTPMGFLLIVAGIFALISGMISSKIRKGLSYYKSCLSQRLQNQDNIPPTYHITEELRTDRGRWFTVEVCHQGHRMGKGEGWSMASAEIEAARDALEKMGVLSEEE